MKMHRTILRLEEPDNRQFNAPPASAAPSPAELGLVIAIADPKAKVSEDGFDFKRLMDIVGSLMLILILAPALLLIAVLIIATDPGPPVFAHRRVGRNGRSFRCFKFRTMCIDAEARLDLVLAADPLLQLEWERNRKLSCDPRITPIGQLLRMTSMDELPQLFNVLGGTMSLVGPRPIVADELRQYGHYASHYLQVRPGLTGLWQVTGRGATSYHRRVATDVHYVRTRSLALDCRILLLTIPAVLMGRGAC